MPRNGSGSYTPPAGTAATANTTIESAKYNDFLDDNAAAHSAAIVADGQKPFSANQPMGNHKLTGLAAGTTNGDSVRYEQSSASILTTRGDLLRRGASAAERVALGTAGQVLKAGATDPAWATVTGADVIYDDSGNFTKRTLVTVQNDHVTLAAADRGQLHRSGAASKTWTLPAASSGLAGWQIEIDDAAGGTAISSPSTDIYANGAAAATSYTCAQGEWGTLKCIDGSGYVLNTNKPAASTTVRGTQANATAAIARAKSSTTTTLTPSNLADLEFESSEITITLGTGSSTLAHGLGVKPKRVQAFIRCKTTELGYAVGEEVPVYFSDQGTTARNAQAFIVDSTYVGYVIAASNFVILSKSTFLGVAITTGNWKLVIRAGL